MISFDKALEFAEKIYDLKEEIEKKFIGEFEVGNDWSEKWSNRVKRTHNFMRLDNPVYHDCILNLFRAYEGLRNYALGYKAEEAAS